MPSSASHTAYKCVLSEVNETSASDCPAAYFDPTLAYNPRRSTHQHALENEDVDEIKDTMFCQVCLDISELGKAQFVKVANPVLGD